MKRDPRQFIVFRWTLLDAPNRLDTRLSALWRERFGYIPPFDAGAVAGYHFRIQDGQGRAVVFTRPSRVQITGSVMAQTYCLIASKYRVETVRAANGGELPTLQPRRPVAQLSLDGAEWWPPEGSLREPIVAEYVAAEGWFLAQPYPTQSLERAAVVVDETEIDELLGAWPDAVDVHPRYLAAARAEADQREAALLDGKT